MGKALPEMIPATPEERAEIDRRANAALLELDRRANAARAEIDRRANAARLELSNRRESYISDHFARRLFKQYGFPDVRLDLAGLDRAEPNTNAPEGSRSIDLPDFTIDTPDFTIDTPDFTIDTPDFDFLTKN